MTRDEMVGHQEQRPEKPSRFSATPAEIDRYLRRILAEDTYLAYQWVIGNLAVEEAARGLRTAHATHPAIRGGSDWVDAADYIDPAKGGGHYPSELLCSRHNGFGPCPGAPQCTPRDGAEEDQLKRGGAELGKVVVVLGDLIRDAFRLGGDDPIGALHMLGDYLAELLPGEGGLDAEEHSRIYRALREHRIKGAELQGWVDDGSIR